MRQFMAPEKFFDSASDFFAVRLEREVPRIQQMSLQSAEVTRVGGGWMRRDPSHRSPRRRK